MRSLFLMSLFGFFMLAAISSQSTSSLTLATPAFANQKDDIKAANLAQADADKARNAANDAQAKANIADAKALSAEEDAKQSDTEEAKKAEEIAKEEAKTADEFAKKESMKAEEATKNATDAIALASALHCPAGITTCYGTDGTEYTDPNNLPATAAGSEGEDENGGALVSVVKPSHFRSF